MAQLMHTVRFFIGMTMLVGGFALVQPFAAAVVAARVSGATAAGPAVAPVPGPQPAASPLMMGMGGHAIPDQRPVDGPGSGDVPLAGGDQFSPATQPPPPPPPAPLPASGLELTPAAPMLVGTYRSTVEIPPPPLLDGHAPPPLSAGWTVHDVPQQPAPAAHSLQQAAATTTYVVRDGDDLTGIALKVYGHAGAATAIWAVNRDRLTDPQLLPIGLSLQLPPTWTMPSVLGARGGAASLAIEPSYAAHGSDPFGATSAVPAGQQAGPFVVGSGVAESPWLQGQVTEASTAIAAAGPRRFGPEPVAVQGGRPATVRVGVGDSLEKIAVRFYGDSAMATRIWEANRDRLRSPDLLVPGGDLRLP